MEAELLAWTKIDKNKICTFVVGLVEEKSKLSIQNTDFVFCFEFNVELWFCNNFLALWGLCLQLSCYNGNQTVVTAAFATLSDLCCLQGNNDQSLSS